MRTLSVTAYLDGSVFLPHGWCALDAVLAWAEAQRRHLPPPAFGEIVPVEIPVARESEGRFHMASFFLPEWECWEKQHTVRRPVIEAAQIWQAKKWGRLSVATGPNKAYRIPREVGFPKEGRITAYCVGEREELISLLAIVSHLGKKTGVGLGRVTRWDVEETAPWDGFPEIRDGLPLRHLPVDYPGLYGCPSTALVRLSYPYWQGPRVECAIPEVVS